MLLLSHHISSYYAHRLFLVTEHITPTDLKTHCPHSRWNPCKVQVGGARLENFGDNNQKQLDQQHSN